MVETENSPVSRFEELSFSNDLFFSSLSSGSVVDWLDLDFYKF